MSKSSALIVLFLISVALPICVTGCMSDQRYRPLIANDGRGRKSHFIVISFPLSAPYKEKKTFSGDNVNSLINDLIYFIFKVTNFVSTDRETKIYFIHYWPISLDTECTNITNVVGFNYTCVVTAKNVYYG